MTSFNKSPAHGRGYRADRYLQEHAPAEAPFPHLPKVVNADTRKPPRIDDKQAEEGPEVEHHVIGELVDIPLVHVEEPGDNDEVGAAAYRQKFRDALYGAHDNALNGCHRLTPGGWKLKPTSR